MPVETSLSKFIHRLVTGYLVRGYVFYVPGHIPTRIGEEKLPQVDDHLERKFRCTVSRSTRVRRKRPGLANCQYLRFHRDFLLLCTHGHGDADGTPHPFFAEHGSRVGEGGRLIRRRPYRDFRKEPLRFHGYSIALRFEGRRPASSDGGKVPASASTPRRGSVRIEEEEFRALKTYLVDEATRRRSPERMGELLHSLPYEPSAPVRQQLISLLRAVNRARKVRGWEPVPSDTLRLKRGPWTWPGQQPPSGRC